MSRNEVEIDLNKFMSMVSEIGELKAKIMELENDKEPDNPWQIHQTPYKNQKRAEPTTINCVITAIRRY